MSKQKPTLQIGILVFSGLVLVVAVVFFVKSASDLLETNILESNLSDEIEKVVAPVTYETRIAKGDALYDSGYYTLAATEYAFAINIQDVNPEGHFKLGNTYMQMQDFEQAVFEYSAALSRSPSDPHIKLFYGISLIRNKQFQDAQELFELFPAESQEAQYYIGLLNSLSGRFEEAQNNFQAAASIEGKISKEYLALFQDAFTSYNDQKDRQDIYLKTLLAKSMIDAEEYQLAEELATAVLNEKNDYRDAWILLGYAKLKTKLYQDAEDAFMHAKKLDAVKPETHYFLATTHYFQNEYEEAINEYELALLYGFQPELEPYKKIAESQLFLEKYEDALAAFEQIVQIDRSNVDLFIRPVWIAITYVQDLNRAHALAQEAVNRFPMNAMSHNLLAWVYIEQDAIELADQEISAALTLDPNLAEAHYNAGLLREKQGHIEGAKWEYKKAHELAKSGDSISALAAERYNAIILNESQQTTEL